MYLVVETKIENYLSSLFTVDYTILKMELYFSIMDSHTDETKK